jgi:hypothetical protein
MFEQFCETIEDMPTPAVRNFIARIHGTFEDALLYKRIDQSPELHSILCFCQFMRTISEDGAVVPVDGLPVRHIAFYGRVVTRLIEAGDLPPAARTRFEAVFSESFLRGLMMGQIPQWTAIE